jgi:nitroreductase
MDALDALRGRRSVRRFKVAEVAEEKIREIADAFFLAPSAGNLQARELILVRDKKLKEGLSRAALGQDFIGEAPIVFVACTNEKKIVPYGRRGVELYCLQDASAGVENMLLAAYALGFGACWVGAFREEEVSRILNLPEYVRPIAIVPVGYAGEKPAAPLRDKRVHSDGW